jgi:hypothetical protein
MQSPMVAMNANLLPTDLTSEKAVRGAYSELMVLQSAAGYYVGTKFQEFDAHGNVVWEEPGSRDSGYFRTPEAAAVELRQFEGGDLSEARFEP